MFKKVKHLLYKIKKYCTYNNPATMSDVEIKMELYHLFDIHHIFNSILTPRESVRFNLLLDIIKQRGYENITGATGINFVKINKKD